MNTLTKIITIIIISMILTDLYYNGIDLEILIIIEILIVITLVII